MNALTDFINSELYPELFRKIDQAFPEMEFRKRRAGWGSAFHLDGNPGKDRKQEQCFIASPAIGIIKEWGTGDYYSLIDFEIRRQGRNPGDKDALIEAVKRLSGLCGLSLPTFEESEQWKEYKAKQDKLEAVTAKMQAALYSQEGTATREYLYNVRHYTDEDIRLMGLGYIGAAQRDELAGIVGSLPEGTGEAFTLAIPYRSGNSIRGFKFRTTDPARKDKYRNTPGLPKNAFLFGLTGLRLSGDRERDKDITIVEGELDALRASCKGVPNICAAAGGDIGKDAIAQAAKMGVKRITLLFDADEAGRKKIPAALDAIAAAGLSGYVATLPEGPDGGKMDADEYLNTHTAEDLESIIKKARRGAMYLYDTIVQKYVEKEKEDPLSDKDFDDLAGELVALMNSPKASQEDRDRIVHNAEYDFIGEMTAETIRDKADAIRAEHNRITQTQETIRKAERAAELARAGKTKEAIEEMIRAEDLKKITDESRFSALLRIPTESEFLRKMSDVREGIKTGFLFGDVSKGPTQAREDLEEMIIPSGQITLIAGGTSHGKSKFLQNLALKLAQDDADGDILYFTYEEEDAAVMRQFTNLYADMTLSQNNLRTIENYFRTGGDTRYFKDWADVDEFKEKADEFRRRFLATGKLRIFNGSPYYSQELVRAIRYLSEHMKIRAVFIDYAQMLHREKNTDARNQELKEISDEIKNTAVELKLPVIMAAQLSREAGTPDAMTAQTLADSADLERYANVVLCIWNCAATPNKKQDATAWENGNSLRNALLSNYSISLGSGGRGKIYAKLCKNRGGTINIDTVLDFNGNTGKISQSFPEPSSQAGPRTVGSVFGK
jgi:DNA primase